MLAAAPGTAVAQEAPKWTVQVDPLTTALGFVHVQVEKALAPHWSIYAGPHLRLYDSPLTGEKLDFQGHGVEVGVRRFFSGQAPAGAWLQVRGVVAHVTTEVPAPEQGVGGDVSALGGYTAIWGGRWLLAGGLGYQYLRYGIAGRGPRGFFPAAHTTVGVAF